MPFQKRYYYNICPGLQKNYSSLDVIGDEKIKLLTFDGEKVHTCDYAKMESYQVMEMSNKRKTGSSGMDMLHGSMLDKMLLFALPLAAGSILQQLFNAVDVAVVGQFASSQALAAVGANTPVISLMVNLFVGISVGSNVVIANYIGQRAENRIKGAVHTSIMVAIISGVFLMLLGLVVAKPLLQLMSTPEDVIDLAVVYLRIYCIGMPFTMVYNFGAAILRSVGDTRKPLYCLILSGVVNAGLNLIFVIVFHMGVSGVAIATVISNILSAWLVVRFLMRADETVRLNLKEIRIQKDELVRILRIGLPAGLQGMVFSVANVCIQASINGFGSDAVAGSAAAANFEYFSYYAVSGYSSAVMTFMSQNLGAGKVKRCRKAFAIGMVCAVITCLILNTVVYLCKDFCIGIFTSEPAVAEYAVLRLKYVLLLHFLICTYEITGSALRGLGHSLTPALLTVFGTCVLRLVWINTVAVKYHTFPVLMSVYPFSWMVTGVMVIISFIVIWKKHGYGKITKI